MSNIQQDYIDASVVYTPEAYTPFTMELDAIDILEANQITLSIMEAQHAPEEVMHGANVLEVSLVKQIVNEARAVPKMDAEYGREAKPGFFGKILEAVKKFLLNIWRRATFQKRTIIEMLEKIEKRLRKEIKSPETPRRDKGTKKIYIRNIVETKKLAIDYFNFVIPATAKLLERIKTVGTGDVNASAGNGPLLERSKELQTKSSKINSEFIKLINRMKQDDFSDFKNPNQAHGGVGTNTIIKNGIKDIKEYMTKISGELDTY